MASLKFQIPLFLIITFVILGFKDREYNVKMASITDSNGFLHEFMLNPDNQGLTSSTSASHRKSEVRDLVVYTSESSITVYTGKYKYIFPNYISAEIR